MLRKYFIFLTLLAMLVPCAMHRVWADDDDNDPEQTQEEISIGSTASKHFEKQVHGVVTQGPVVARLGQMLKRMRKATGRTDLPYQVKLVDIPDVNAITFPGGFIYFFRGLLDLHPDDDMLACVLGHEMAHAARSHGYRAMKAAEALGNLGNVAQIIMVTGVGRHYENEADQLGMRYALASGYNPRGMLRMMESFKHLSETNPGLIGHLLATHPPPSERIRRVNAELKHMGK